MVHYKGNADKRTQESIVERADRIVKFFHHSKEAEIDGIKEGADKDKYRAKSVLGLLLGRFSIGLDQDGDSQDAQT